MNSREKGKRGERELAKVLKEYGYDCRRTQQYAGGMEESADVVGLPYIHIECKRVQALNLDDAMNQAIRDSKGKNMPTVFHRKNNQPWKVTMRLDDWIELYREWESGKVLNER
jgi:Holliday junction resolvase